jgi:hypothetical protein
MGYTHYWRRPRVIPAKIFQAIRRDFERIILPLADSGVYVADGLGEGVPVITDDDIRFNGLRYCGHSRNESISIPFPSADASGIGPSESASEESSDGWTTAVKHRCCDGKCSYETFDFPRCL